MIYALLRGSTRNHPVSDARIIRPNDAVQADRKIKSGTDFDQRGSLART
jgi:hypothetical protein